MRIVFLLVLLLGVGASAAGEEYLAIPGVVHLDSKVSAGKLTPDELIEYADQSGVRVAIVTDHDTMRWEYGIPPFRSLSGRIMGWVAGKLKKQSSIATYGAQRYINTFERLDREYPNLMVIHGSEVIPFYYWGGSLWRRKLELRNGNKHLLVIGLDDAEDYERLPSVGEGTFPKSFGWGSLFALWPLGLVVWGLHLLSAKRTARAGSGDETYYVTGQQERPYGFLGVLCLVVAGLFLIENVPFRRPLYDAYHGDPGIGPYQYLIDYVNRRGGMVFWAHPESDIPKTYSLPLVTVEARTPPYYEDLLKADDYTGFAAFAEGMKYVIPPGGVWDQVLLEYCAGSRARPIWAIGEVDFGDVDDFSIIETETVFLVREETKAEVLDALRTGRMYAIHGTGTDRLFLDRFTVDGANMGEEISASEAPEIAIEVRCLDRNAQLQATLIRNGKVFRQFEGKGELRDRLRDDYMVPGETVYYRLDVSGPARIVSNPIFVTFGGEG